MQTLIPCSGSIRMPPQAGPTSRCVYAQRVATGSRMNHQSAHLTSGPCTGLARIRDASHPGHFWQVNGIIGPGLYRLACEMRAERSLHFLLKAPTVGVEIPTYLICLSVCHVKRLWSPAVEVVTADSLTRSVAALLPLASYNNAVASPSAL